METIKSWAQALSLFLIWLIVEALIQFQFLNVVKLKSSSSKLKKELLSWTMSSVDVRLEFMLPLISHCPMVITIHLNLFTMSIHKPEQMDTLTLSILAWTFLKIMIKTNNSQSMDSEESFQETVRLVIVLLLMEIFTIRKLTVLMELLMLITKLSTKFNSMVEQNSQVFWNT